YLLAPLSDIEIVDDWQVLGLAGTGSKSLVLHDVFIPEHRCVMVSDLFKGTPPGALVHPDYPVLRAPRGFLVSYSLPPVCIALGRRALEIACRSLSGRVSRGVTRVAQSEVVQMTLGEAAAAIDVATTLLPTGRDASRPRRPRGVARHALRELAGRRAGQFGGEIDRTRTFDVRQPRPAEGEQFRREIGAGAGDVERLHDGFHLLAHLLVGNAEDRGV